MASRITTNILTCQKKLRLEHKFYHDQDNFYTYMCYQQIKEKIKTSCHVS